jgi:hypothetical protein
MNPKEGREDSSSARRADGSETFFYRLVSSRLRSPAGRIPDQVGLIAHAKLPHELRAVRLDGAGADLESIGGRTPPLDDLPIPGSLGHGTVV